MQLQWLLFVCFCIAFAIPVHKRKRLEARSMDSNEDTSSQQPMLALPWKRFSLDFAKGEFELIKPQITPLFVVEQPNSGLGTGLNVWDGAVVLSGYLEHQLSSVLPGKTVVEVGSGTGLVGVAAAALGATTVLTDLPYCLDNLKHVVKLNEASHSGRASALALDWYHPEQSQAGLAQAFQASGTPRPDYVLGADVVWVPELIEPLVDTLSYLAGPSPSPVTILLSHQTRATASDELLLGLLKDRGFTVTVVPRDEHHPRWRDQAINIFRITR